MSSCQFCQTSLSDELLVAGRCPTCGSVLSWASDPDDVVEVVPDPSLIPAPIEDAPVEVDAAEAPGAVAVDESEPEPPPAEPPTVDDTTATSADPEDRGIADTTPEVGAADEQGSSHGESELSQTVVPRQLSAAEHELVTVIWQGSFSDDTIPEMTIKASGPSSPEASKLVIQKRSMRLRGEPGPPADYEILEQIGKGGVGVVYAARQASINRTVAVKTLKPEIAADPEQRDKFLAEAVVTGDLDHPNIVPVHDLGSDETGALFYSMKRVGGTPWLEAMRNKSVHENLEILIKVADAIAFAHSRGVVHRDLKPENIMLGGFGEVLVMDWGVALSSSLTLRSGTVTESGTMGGTPAYMAPEMATGPIEAITGQSDIYLLGGMLFEMITGKTPHTAANVIDCLYAAAGNEIQPTEKSGELLEIAYHAMATDPEDRYGDVQEFQAALRDYVSHSESVSLSDRAEEDLRDARKSDDYSDYARSLFAFEEAVALWDKNANARAGITSAKLAYAGSALNKGDYDLGLSLLDENESSHAVLGKQLRAAQKERETRARRLQNVRRMVAALLVVIAAGGVGAAVLIQREAANARKAEGEANLAAQVAEDARIEAEAKRTEAENARIEAEKARAEEAVARDNAIAAQAQAEDSAQEALTARGDALRAKEAEEYEAYVAQIGLAAVKIDANAFGDALRLLQQYGDSDLRNWEWGRLWYLCQQSSNQVNSADAIESVAIKPDGSSFATAGSSGELKIWDAESLAPVTVRRHGTAINSVAYSPDGGLIATAGDDSLVQLWDSSETAAEAEPVLTLSGHEDGVTSVAFSPDGRQVLTASYDKSVRVWNVSGGETNQTLLGHSWWVWSAVFSPDGGRIVTTGQDGKVIVWARNTDRASEQYRRETEFTGHRVPVYAAAFAPDGAHVVTADYEGRVLIWNPNTVRPPDIASLISDEVTSPPESVSLTGHTGPVRSVAFSPDGRAILAGGHDNTVAVWDTETGQLIKSLRGHGGWVRSCLFSPDGEWVLSGSHDGLAKIWNVAGYEEVRVLQGRVLRGHEDDVMSAAFDSQGERIVTASRDRTARVWDVDSMKSQVFAEGHEFLASTAVFFANGRRLITAAIDNTVRIWDVTSGTQLMLLEATGQNAAVALSSDEKWIATGSSDNSLKIWDVAAFDDAVAAPVPRELEGHEQRISAVDFSRDSQMLVTGDADGVCRLWQLDGGEWVAFRELPRRHTRVVTSVKFLPGGSQILTASSDNTVARWDVARGVEIESLILKHPDSVSAMEVSPDGQFVATISRNREGNSAMWLWRTDNARLIRSYEVPRESMHSAAFSRTGRYILTAGSERKLRLWDVETGLEVGPARDAPVRTPFLDLSKQAVPVWSALFSPEGDQIVTVGGNGARLWDRASGKALISFRPHGTVASAGFSPDGKFIITGSWDNSAKIWNLETDVAEWKLAGGHSGSINRAVFSPVDSGMVVTASADATAKIWKYDEAANQWRILQTLQGHSAGIQWAAFSPDGARIVTASADQTARIWDLTTAQTVAVLQGHTAPLLCAAFSADGKRVVTGGTDKIARVWNSETGELITLPNPLQGHTAGITAAAFSPDGRRILTGSLDSTAKIWDGQTGNEILTLRGHSREMTSVAFSPDGRTVLTGSRDGTAILWLAVDWRDKVATGAPSADAAR